jgi:hypothetical protein
MDKVQKPANPDSVGCLVFCKYSFFSHFSLVKRKTELSRNVQNYYVFFLSFHSTADKWAAHTVTNLIYCLDHIKLLACSLGYNRSLSMCIEIPPGPLLCVEKCQGYYLSQPHKGILVMQLLETSFYVKEHKRCEVWKSFFVILG